MKTVATIWSPNGGGIEAVVTQPTEDVLRIELSNSLVEIRYEESGEVRLAYKPVSRSGPRSAMLDFIEPDELQEGENER